MILPHHSHYLEASQFLKLKCWEQWRNVSTAAEIFSQLWNDTLNSSSSQFFSSSFLLLPPSLTSSSPSFMSYEGKWWMNMKKRHREVSYWLCCCRCISYASVSSIARVVVQWCTFSIMHQPQIFLCLIGFCGRLKQLHGRLFKFLGLRLTWIEQDLQLCRQILFCYLCVCWHLIRWKNRKIQKGGFVFAEKKKGSRQIRQFDHITKRCHFWFFGKFFLTKQCMNIAINWSKIGGALRT